MEKYPFWPYSSCTEAMEHEKRLKSHEERLMRLHLSQISVKIKSVSREESMSLAGGRLSPYSPYSDTFDPTDPMYQSSKDDLQSDAQRANAKFSKEETFFLLAFGMPISLGGIKSMERPPNKVNLFALAENARKESIKQRKMSFKMEGIPWPKRKYSSIDLVSENGRTLIPVATLNKTPTPPPSSTPSRLSKRRSPMVPGSSPEGSNKLSPSSPRTPNNEVADGRSVSPYPPILNPPALKPPPKLQYSWESEGYHSGREEDVSEVATPPPKINVEGTTATETPATNTTAAAPPSSSSPTPSKGSQGWPSYARSHSLATAEPVERNRLSPNYNAGYGRSQSMSSAEKAAESKKNPKQRVLDDTKLDKERETFFLLTFGMPMSGSNSCTMDHTC